MFKKTSHNRLKNSQNVVRNTKNQTLFSVSLPLSKNYFWKVTYSTVSTVCVIRMYLFGTSTSLRYGMIWQTHILGVIASSGTRLGSERPGLSGCQYGKDLKEDEIESDALFGHPADTNLGQAHDAKSPYRQLQLKPKNPRPNLK
jgi:hypothetical protein